MTKYLVNTFGYFLMIITWMGGIVLAPAGYLLYVAIFFPPYSWYLFIEKIMKVTGLA